MPLTAGEGRGRICLFTHGNCNTPGNLWWCVSGRAGGGRVNRPEVSAGRGSVASGDPGTSMTRLWARITGSNNNAANFVGIRGMDKGVGDKAEASQASSLQVFVILTRQILFCVDFKASGICKRLVPLSAF